MRPTIRSIRSIPLAVGALALVAACGSGAGGSSGGSSSAQPPAAASSGQASGQASGQVQGTKVTATLTDFHIALSPNTFGPGTYTFVATNSGQATHALAINGPGVSNQQTGDVSPGRSADLTVTLKAGSYDVYCPVDDHKSMGMDLTIKVGSGGASGSSGSSGTTSASGGSGGGYGGY